MTALPSRVVAFATLCALSVPAAAQQRERTVTWPKEVCDAAARLPVQQGGRVKPLHTFAGFQLLRLNGKRTFTTAWGERLTPIEWLLDCWFFPKQAWDYQCIVVDDVRVIEAIGLPGGAKKRRDRYSLRELEPAFSKLGELGKKLEEKDPKRRTTLDSQIFNLSQVVPQMRYALGFLRFARDPVVTTGVKPLAEMFPGREKVPFLEFMGRFAEFRTRAEKLESDESLRPVAELLYFAKDFGRYAAVIPPPAGSEVFSSPGDILHAMWTGVPVHQEQMRWMHRFEELVGKTQDLEGLGAGLVALQKDLREAGTGHFDYGKVDMEVRFYQADWFYKALYLFLFGFLVCAFLWFLSGLGNVTRGGARRMLRLASYGTAITLVVGGEALLIIGIVIRCILRGRPPVTTPYEVVLFCVAVVLLIALFIEFLRRNVLALSLAATTGALGMAVAAWHEEAEGADTMAPLVAVLDTNFWLSTHVTMVSLGYGAGVFAALIAHLYIFSKVLTLFRTPPSSGWLSRQYFSDLTRITYGVLCFGLAFSTVGTILGGVWANDSWGRFWGWDPKENGALMLVLMYLAIAHARMGGYVREFGLALCSVITGIVVMWAFWGVNLLSIGLHSYGFDETKAAAWWWYRCVEWSVVGLGLITCWLHRAKARSPVSAGAPALGESTA